MTLDHTPARATTDPKEYKWPAILLAAGVGVYLLWAVLTGGLAGLVSMMILLPVRLTVQIVLGVIACFITAKIMSIDFGMLSSALVKLAAIFVFPAAATFYIPWVGWFLSLVIYWKLLEWLFDLEVLELVVLVILIWIVNFGALILLGYLGFILQH